MSDGEEKGEALPWPSSASSSSSDPSRSSDLQQRSPAVPGHASVKRQLTPLEEAREQAQQARRDIVAKQQAEMAQTAAAASAASSSAAHADPFADLPSPVTVFGGSAVCVGANGRSNRLQQSMSGSAKPLREVHGDPVSLEAAVEQARHIVATTAAAIHDPFSFTPFTSDVTARAAAFLEANGHNNKHQQSKGRSSASSSAARLPQVHSDPNPLATLFTMTTGEGQHLWLCTHCERTFELVGPSSSAHMADIKRLHAEQQQGSLSSSPPVVLTVAQRISAYLSKHPGTTLSPGGSICSVGPTNPAIAPGTPLRPPAPSFNELMRATLSGIELEMHMEMENIGKRPVEPLIASSAVFPPSRGVPAPRLPPDALESVFCLLTFAELGRAIRVCRDWRDAVGIMAPLEQSTWSPGFLSELPRERSSLARHVRAVEKLHIDNDRNSSYSFSRRFTNLTRLEVSVTLTGCRLHFPPLLVSLHLTIGPTSYWRDQVLPTAEEITAAVSEVTQLERLQELRLQIPYDSEEFRLDLSVLQFCAALRYLALKAMPLSAGLNGPRLTFSDRQMDDLRALVHLDCFEYSQINHLFMQRLLRRPHALEWKELRGFRFFTAQCADLLSWLPTLTAVDFDGEFECGSLDFLDDLHEMQFINLRFDKLMSSRAVFQGLSHLSKLTHLQLMCSPLDTAQMTSLLAKLPLLDVLDLRFSTRFDSLSYLAACPSSTRLLSLTVCSTAECKAPLLDLRYLHRFRCLQYLKLSHVFNEQMDSYTRSLFEPPSVILPSLQRLVLAYPGDEKDLRYQRFSAHGPRPVEEVVHRF